MHCSECHFCNFSLDLMSLEQRFLTQQFKQVAYNDRLIFGANKLTWCFLICS